MSVTILEVLQNAQINLIQNGNTQIGRMIGSEQLNNAIELLEKGYGIDEVFDEIIEEHGSVKDAPYKNE